MMLIFFALLVWKKCDEYEGGR
jgi:hypothetical protein